MDGDYHKTGTKPVGKPPYKGTKYIVHSRTANGAYKLQYKEKHGGFLDRRVPLDQMYVLSGPKYRDRDDEHDWQVDKLLNDRVDDRGQREYLVKWKGFSAEEATWEPEDNINEEDLIRKYMTAKGVNPAPGTLTRTR